MVINFLQHIRPPVLPYLQDSKSFNLTEQIVDGCRVQFAKPPAKFIKKFRKNKLSVGELFISFFAYFDDFDWKQQVIQIQSPINLYKLDKEWQRSPLAIEDPFDLSHNLSSGVRLPSNIKCT